MVAEQPQAADAGHSIESRSRTLETMAKSVSKAKLNPRLADVCESATLAMNNKSRAMRSAGRPVVMFGFGQSPFPVHARMRAALARFAGESGYLPALGLPRLREAIATHYRTQAGLDFAPERIAIAPGSKESIFHLLYLLEGPLILPTPAWVSYRPQARLLGKRVVAVPTFYEKGYKLEAGRLDAALRKTGASQSVMLVNSPNNPSGQQYGTAEWRGLAAVCRRHNVYVISDEIYGELRFADGISPSLAAHCPERTVITGGLSKSRAAGGWRLGFAAGASPQLQHVFDALATLISETYSCVSAPVQHAAAVGYEDEEVFAYARDCAKLLSSVLEYTRRHLLDAGLRCLPASGGFYLYPDFSPFARLLRRRGIHTARAMCDALLEEAGVALLPAEDFSGKAGSYACRLAAVDFDGARLYRAYRRGGDHAAATRNPSRWIPGVVEGCNRLHSWIDALRKK